MPQSLSGNFCHFGPWGRVLGDALTCGLRSLPHLTRQTQTFEVARPARHDRPRKIDAQEFHRGRVRPRDSFFEAFPAAQLWSWKLPGGFPACTRVIFYKKSLKITVLQSLATSDATRNALLSVSNDPAHAATDV